MELRKGIALLITAGALAGASSARAEVRTAFAYRLADSGGTLPLSWAALTWDASAGELYALDTSNGTVDIFNSNGMSVYSFGNDAELGAILAVAPLPGGDIAVLGQKPKEWQLSLCNFRGELKAPIAVQVPAAWADFSPSSVRYANGHLYLADFNAMRVLIVGVDGAASATLDLRRLLKIKPKNFEDGLRGFNVDRQGNVLGTVSGLFLAFVVTPEGKATTFGGRGSQPGLFNIVAGIAADEQGNIWLTDALRAAVMVYDPQLKFIDEFGYHDEDDAEGLLSPNDIAVAGGRVFVSQSRGGVKAFDVSFR
ncbi:MAG TPA: hypothetical protein VLW85_04345 [Myxococcales bacterium]|nr:hypothetical protein [Myxococcales bacterium]